MYYNHSLRTNLQEWKNRLYRAPYEQLGHQLKYCIGNIEGNKILNGLLHEVILKYPYTEEQLSEFADALEYRQTNTTFENEVQHASYSYSMLKHFIKVCDSYNLHQFTIFSAGDFEETKKGIIEEYITPVFYYFHDRLDKSNSVIYLLEKYKKRTEWFTFNILLDKYLFADKNYEQIFEDDLRLFLFDQGIDYPFSTPKSTSGRGDIIGLIDTGDPIIIEIKIFDREKGYGKKRIVEGFSQIIKYANDYHKDVGYLIIFNTDKAELDFILDEKTKVFPPMVILNNKSFFIITINLYRGVSASKIGMTEVISISERDLTL